MNKTLIDAEARERAQNDLSTTYLVEAAAGTGKTTLLVARILTIVRETLTPLSRVAAITFTEKAAGELKVKLRERLEEGARGTGEEAEQYRKALTDLDLMPVSTIHAFCRDLLAQRPVEAGVDPKFTLADETTARMLLDECWQAWLADEFSRECPAVRPFLERGLEADGDRHSLYTLFTLLNSYREDLEALHVPCWNAAELKRAVEEFCAEIAHALQSARGCRDENDLLAQELRQVGRWLDNATWETAARALASLEKRHKPNRTKKGRKEAWAPEALDAARKFFHDEFEPRAMALMQQITSYLAAPLIEWLKGAVRAYTAVKSERSLLDFHDLLILARDMLRDSRAARDYFKARFDYLLVDEFQDTDPLQAEIVFFLGERTDSFADVWDEVVLEHGKLFIVGDPKQSIYRFRRADLDLYGRVREKIESSGECLPIRVNFRSDPAIIEEVNAVFTPWMAGPTATRYEPEYIAMQAWREPQTHGPAAVLLPPPTNLDLEQSNERLAAAEAACLAEHIAELVATGRTSVAGNGVHRPIAYRDMAILYRATTHLGALESALRGRGIPYQVSGGKDLPKRSEIQAVRTVLAAICNPFDTVAVIGALRSAFIGCSDEELLNHKLDGGRFDYVTETPTPPHLARGFALLKQLHTDAATRAPSATLAALYAETAGVAVYALKPQGESRVANLLKLVEMARGFESGGSYSLNRLVHWLNRLEELHVGEDDSPIAESGDDVVQLMTFHKAKGLEFPVVLLYRLGQNHEQTREAALARRGGKTVEFHLSGLETAGYSAALADERDREWHEAMRLFYVAMTRARDRLVIPVYWGNTKRQREGQWFFKLLMERCARGAGGAPEPGTSAFVPVDTSQYSLETPPQEGLVLDFAGEQESVAAVESRLNRALWRQARDGSVAKLKRTDKFIRPSDHDTLARVSGVDSARVQTQDDAKRFGNFIHAALQRIDLPYAKDLVSVLDEAAAEFRMNAGQRAEGEALLKRALSSELFIRRILPAGKWYRELPFTVEIDGRLMDGAMDLVFFEAGKPVIVDFKTDRVRREDVAQRAQVYLPQAEAYARALETILEKGRPAVVLYFIRADAVVEG